MEARQPKCEIELWVPYSGQVPIHHNCLIVAQAQVVASDIKMTKRLSVEKFEPSNTQQ
jgi:hypothetical protein